MMKRVVSKLKRIWSSFKTFIIECRRVFQVTKKPTNEELKTIVKISGLGMIAIGAIGFLIQLTTQLFK